MTAKKPSFGAGLPAGRTAVALTLLALLTTHAGLLAWGAWRHSPTWDEVGHLAAGLSHWHFGRFDLYSVNPPLVRMVAALPAFLAGPEVDWQAYGEWRSEFTIGSKLVSVNASRSFWLMTLARWACIPFSLLGAYVCFRWARELYGVSAGFLALSMWCFSPNILTHAQLITPDVGAAALGVTAAYAFWRWLRHPDWPGALAAGALLGLAELTKTTLIVLFPLWPALWLVWKWPRGRTAAGNETAKSSPPTADAAPDRWMTEGEGHTPKGSWLREACQMGTVLLVAIYFINLGYGFENSFERLGRYPFVSRTFAGADGYYVGTGQGRNRFIGTWLARLPVPLPRNYLLGIDRQRADFEDKMWSYLRGEWRLGGWWYYYLYALAIKAPLGTWALLLLSLLARRLGRGRAGTWRDEWTLLAPPLVILALVSSQTGFSHHLRYLLPAFPWAYVWMGRVAQSLESGNRRLAVVVAAALCCSAASSLYCYPHSLSYFNELAGGPRWGHCHLGCSNIDWGQDLFYLRDWLDEHPEARPITLAYDVPLIEPKDAGIDYVDRPPTSSPQPGWHAVSVNQIHGQSGDYAYFLRFQPAAMAGYSIYIYHVTPDDADGVPCREEQR